MKTIQEKLGSRILIYIVLATVAAVVIAAFLLSKKTNEVYSGFCTPEIAEGFTGPKGSVTNPCP